MFDFAKLPPLIYPWLPKDSPWRQGDVPTAGDLLGCGRSTMEKLVKRGHFKVVKLSDRKQFITSESLREFIAAGGVK